MLVEFNRIPRKFNLGKKTEIRTLLVMANPKILKIILILRLNFIIIPQISSPSVTGHSKPIIKSKFFFLILRDKV